ncbi:hypothetical protein [Ohtaekwangia koreensis]|uniref:RiboL-PSP-HEPN domain-containing protein n=1 Tax=Ohtaekwangia koreensis TaxID=688867 RepID=A0A1T5J713_9BACT|nr:hypothetical protein [Ohtaekwangia koreensis]SKC47136.1 hypothetical protein SAMN05660236_0822 [Ohtaekwangia koreensis]
MRLSAPWHWYKLDSIHTLQLLTFFVKRTEQQIDASTEHFKNNKKEDFIVFSEEEKIGQSVTHYEGLDDMGWDLDKLFTSHFPNLQRKSAFLTLYAFLEHELDKLANKLKDEISHPARLEDIAGNGIHRSFSYMQLIVGLKIDKSDNRWNKIYQINKLRNMIIHSDGQLSADETARKSEEKFMAILKSHITVRDGELVLELTFLPYVIQQFDALFQFIDGAIQLKFSTKRSKKKKLSKKKRGSTKATNK